MVCGCHHFKVILKCYESLILFGLRIQWAEVGLPLAAPDQVLSQPEYTFMAALTL